VVYEQQAGLSNLGGLAGLGSLHGPDPAALRGPFLQAFALLSLALAVGAWWMVLGSESRHRAEDESNRQNLLLTQEIEAHRRTDAALQAAKDQAESANQAKTRYVAGITHELRTPLNSILGYAQILLKDGSLNDEPRRAVATIHRSGEHLHGLIDGLLDLARIEAGRLRLDPAPLPMREFLDDLVHMVAPQAAAKNLHFELQTAGRVPEYIRADAKRLRQILLNLLGNAVRFTDHGHIILRLDHSREVARLQVIDTGIGIAEQDLERIFMPFERGSAGRRSGDAGTGLGLTITHLLTQLMGGELTVTSTPGQGSTFTVRLYLSEIAAPAQRSVRHHRPVTGYLGPRRSLLVVDDHPTQRQMLAGMLLPLGFQIREAASGSECLESVRDNPPDAVLLDVTMDDMDGWETARRLRAQGERAITGLAPDDAARTAIPIIMVSANAFENRADKLVEAGAQAFVDKPVIESELLVALQRHLQLEWVAELPRPGWAPPALPGAVALPDDYAATLTRLARLGHAQGLQRALGRLLQAHPACAVEVSALRQLVERYAFADLLQRLQQARALDLSDEGVDQPAIQPVHQPVHQPTHLPAKHGNARGEADT
jgi:signal transduction histidine kinase/DNA-binding NarL/FixJ family response regulator